MNRNNVLEKVVIIDFGSQFTQLIARKVREIGIYSEIINFSQIKNLKKDNSIKGIILSGGPLTVTNKSSISLNNYILDLNLPILGICYGHQILAKKFGGKVKISKSRERERFHEFLITNEELPFCHGNNGMYKISKTVNGKKLSMKEFSSETAPRISQSKLYKTINELIDEYISY